MRNLTIVRAKSFVGCAASIKVYIEDPMCDDLTINGCPCRFLGKLKNGEVKTFQIAEAAAKVFVITDKLSKGYCNEYCTLEEGTEDITLTGKNHFNPASGNAFRFDGVTDAEVLANRKKGTRKGIVVLIAACIVGFVIGMVISRGLLNGPAEPKTFEVNDMNITLTDDFRKQGASGFTAGFGTKDVAVLVLEEEFSLQQGFGDLSLKEYANLVVQNSGKGAKVQDKLDFSYFEFDAKVDNGETYHYIAVMYKGPDAFWLIQFATDKDKADEYRTDIFGWAASVTFD